MYDTCIIRNRQGETIKSFSLNNFYNKYNMISVGRSSECVVSLKNLSGVDNSVGREHLKIMNDDNQWYVTETPAQNRIFKNGKRVTKAKFEPGDEIRFGSCLLIFGNVSSETDVHLVWEEEDGTRYHQPLQQGKNYVGRSPKNHIMMRSKLCAYYQGIIELGKHRITWQDVSFNGAREHLEQHIRRAPSPITLRQERPFMAGAIPATVAHSRELKKIVDSDVSLSEAIHTRRKTNYIKWIAGGFVGVAVVLLILWLKMG